MTTLHIPGCARSYPLKIFKESEIWWAYCTCKTRECGSQFTATEFINMRSYFLNASTEEQHNYVQRRLKWDKSHYRYHFIQDGKFISVCAGLFCSVVGISQKTVLSYMKLLDPAT